MIQNMTLTLFLRIFVSLICQLGNLSNSDVDLILDVLTLDSLKNWLYQLLENIRYKTNLIFLRGSDLIRT